MKYLKLFENVASGFIDKLEEVLKKKKFIDVHTDQGNGGSPDTFVTPDWPTKFEARKFDVEELIGFGKDNRTKNLIYALNTWYTINQDTILEDWDYLDKIIEDAIGMEELKKIALEHIMRELLKEIEDNPSLYIKFQAYLDNHFGKKIPDWVKRGGRTGLLGMKTKEEE